MADRSNGTVPQHVWARNLVLPTVEKVILYTLVSHASGKTTCYPGLETLATETGLHRATVIRGLARLDTRGAIHIDRRPGQHHVYHLQPAGPVAQDDGSQSATGRTGRRVVVAQGDGYPSHRTTGVVAQGDPKVEEKVVLEDRRGRERAPDRERDERDDEGGRGGGDPDPAINRGGGVQSSAPLVQSPLRSLHTCARCGRQWRIHFGNVCQRCHLQVGDPVPPPPDPNADPF